MQLLKANTEVKVRIGPFVDVTDGVTPETGITLGAADEAELLKNNGAATVDISGATWSAVTNCDGWYDLTLTASHTDTEGLLTVVVQDDSECLPVFAHFMVLAEAAFGSMFTAKDTGYMDINVKNIEDADPTDTIRDSVVDDATRIDASELNTLSGHDPGATIAKAGDAMTLADDAITSAKYDESTAFPIKSADTGSTQVARVGADGDTLETLSDQLDNVASPPSAATIADAVCDELVSEHSIAGSVGKILSNVSDDLLGPGDYAVTLTIRTTGGSALSGASVWLNTSNTRSGSVAGTKVTDSNGQVTFNLEYTTYYVFCHLSGYTFAAASFTAASGSVTFTKDIATAVSSGSSSFYDDSFLTRAIALVREKIDEPAVNAKYSDASIIRHLENSHVLVLNEKNRQSKTPAVVRQTITVANNTTEYALPYVMGSLYGVYDLSESGTKVFYDGRSRYNPFGQKVWLEGKTLHIQSVDSLGIGTTLTAEWVPDGTARLHNGVCTINSDGDEVTLGATPNAGTLDTHVQAYAGCVLRILGVDGTTVTGNYLAERNITAYDRETRVATLDVALDPIPTTDDGYIYYEIAPPINRGMDRVVSLYAAYEIAQSEGNMKRARGILDAYRNVLRNVRLTEYYSKMDEAPRQRQDGYDNRRYRRLN